MSLLHEAEYELKEERRELAVAEVKHLLVKRQKYTQAILEIDQRIELLEAGAEPSRFDPETGDSFRRNR